MPKPFIYIAAADPVKNIYTATESVDKSNGRKTCFVESKSTSVRKFSIFISTGCNLFFFFVVNLDCDDVALCEPLHDKTITVHVSHRAIYNYLEISFLKYK